jgi:uncharacterized protein
VMERPRLNAVPNGIGLGLRWDFLEQVLDGPRLDLAFFEVSPENYMRRGGYYPAALERLKQRYPVVTHGLTLSLGARDDRSDVYLSQLKDEVDRLDAPWHSDHLAFTSAGDRTFHELLPLPFTRESLRRVAERADALADRLGRPFAVENITYYAELGVPELSESDFIQALCERSRAALLLDVNNVYVNAQNHGFDPETRIAAFPLDRVIEIHVAGHSRARSGLVIDNHGAPVADPVLALLEWTLIRTGPVPVLLERDNDVPPLAVLLEELETLRSVYLRAMRLRDEARPRSHAGSA